MFTQTYAKLSPLSQWNLSNPDTIGTEKKRGVLISGAKLVVCKNCSWGEESVLIREVSSFQGLS